MTRPHITIITLTTWHHPAQTGPNTPGQLWHTWNHPNNTFPLGPTTLLTQTDLLKAVGGWHALPQGEDLAMVMAITSIAPGHIRDDVVYHYRKHPHQTMNTPHFHRHEPLVRAIAYERGRILTDTHNPQLLQPAA